MKKTLFFLFAALMSFVSMSAQEQRPVDNNVIQLNSVDDVATFNFNSQVHAFTFEAIEDGVLEFHVGWSSVMIYLTDRAFNESTKTMLSKQSDDNGNFYFTPVEKGKTYYFSTSLLTDPTEIRVMYGTGDPGISIDANYEDNSLYSITGRDLELTVDRQVNVGRFLVIYGDENTEEVIPTDYIAANYTTAYYITVMLGGLMDYLMDGGKITYGDKFTIRLEGIADASDPSTVYGEDGVFQRTFTLGEKPATVTKISPASGSELYTYYPTDGEDGLITFTFSDPLDETIADEVECLVTYGDMEAGSFAQFNVPFEISGNTVTADLRGITFPEYVEGGRGSAAGNQPTTITLLLRNLKTTDGRDVQTNATGAGSSAVVAYYSIKKQEIQYAVFWDPDQSNTLIFRENDHVTCYITQPIHFDGVTMTYWNGSGRELSKTLTLEDNPEYLTYGYDEDMGAYAIYISLNGVSFYNQGVTISLNNASLMNGDAIQVSTHYEGSRTSGIDAVVTGGDADAVVKVYAVDGTFVKEGAAGTVLQGLPKGLYIVGGKKVVVK